MWEIYSVGDAMFLARVLNAIAMLGGTGNLEQVAAIGMLVGVIILGFQSIIKGGEAIQFQNLFVSWILFLAIFGGGKTVTIHDIYNDQVIVVDNVPQGIAAAGSMASRLGYGITELFEQAFSAVKMTDNGFAFAIEKMADLRKATLTQSKLGSANSPAGGDDMWQSWSNYISDCTLAGVDLGYFTRDAINKGQRDGGPIDQLRFDSQSYGTKIVIASAPLSGFMTCTDAFVTLKNYTNTQFFAALKSRMAQEFNVAPHDVDFQVKNAFEMLNQGSVDTQQYMIATALEPMMSWAIVNNEINFQRTAYGAMLHSSIQQRNDLWATEQALFNTVVRPMMTFFEGLVYAITPMMAFLIGLGPAGISLLSKYLMILIWIQLWMPVLAIINLYLHMAVGQEMNALQAADKGKLPLDSFYGIQSIDQSIQTWIATGGMLAASVPAITLMLIYGSAVTATSLAGRMSSGSPAVDSTSPAMMQNSALLQRGAMVDSSQSRGFNTTDAEKMSLKVNGGFGSALSSSTESSAQSQTAFQDALSSSVMRQYGTTQQAVTAASSKLSEMSANNEVKQAVYSLGNDIFKGTDIGRNMTNEQKGQVAMATQWSGKAGVDGSTGGGTSGAPKSSAGGSVGVSAVAQQMKSLGFSQGMSETDSEKILSNLSSSDSSSAQLTKALAKDATNTDQNSFTNSLTGGNAAQLSKTASEVLSESNKHQAMGSVQRASEVGASFTNETLPGAIRGQEGLENRLNDFYEKYGSQGGLLNNANGIASSIHGMNPNATDSDVNIASKALALADGRYLDNVSDPGLREEMAVEAAGFLGQLTGQSTPSMTAHSANEGVGAGAGAAGLVNKVEQGISHPGASVQGIASEVQHGTTGVRGAIDNTNVHGHHDDGITKVDGDFNNHSGKIEGTRKERAEENISRVVEENRAGRSSIVQSDNLNIVNSGEHYQKVGAIAGSGLNQMNKDAPKGTPQEFMRMSPEEQQSVAADTYSHLYSQYRERGMEDAPARLSAGVVLEDSMKHNFSNPAGTLIPDTREELAHPAITAAARPIEGAEINAFESKVTAASGGSMFAAQGARQDVTENARVATLVEDYSLQKQLVQMSNATNSAYASEKPIVSVIDGDR